MYNPQIRVWDDVAQKMYYQKKTEQFDDAILFRFDHFETEHPIWMCSIGVKDRNGFELYEGDIVLVKLDIEDKGTLHTIVYCGESGYPAFDLKPGFGDESNGISYCEAIGFIERIGNVYENPEKIA